MTDFVGNAVAWAPVDEVGTNERESSAEGADMFRMGGEVRTIPKVKEVLLPPEEILKQRVRRIAAAIAAVLTTLFVVWLALKLMHLSEVEQAVLSASDDGRLAEAEAAVALIADDDLPALTARLRAVSALAGQQEDIAAIQALAESADVEDEDEATERAIALTYLSLIAGDPHAAIEAAGPLAPQGDYAAEAAHAKALSALSVGDLEHALVQATVAQQLRPEAPRHAALLARVLGRRGDVDEALSALGALPAAAQEAPSAQLASARVRAAAAREPELATRGAQSVLADEDASPSEKAWAQLVTSIVAARAGDRLGANAAADLAELAPPPGDEAFAVALAEVRLTSSDLEGARRAQARIPSDYSTDPQRRARLTAWTALDAGDTTAASASLGQAGAGPDTSLLMGRLARAGRQFDLARQHFAVAVSDPRIVLRARAELANLEISEGQAAAAVAAIAPALETDATHPLVAPIAVEAYLAAEDLDRAMSLADAALSAHPNEPSILLAKGHAHMAREQWAEALPHLRRAIEADATDADSQGDRGECARETGAADEARAAYSAALAIDEAHRVALVGVWLLDLEARDPAAAVASLARIDAVDLEGDDIELARARTLVLSGAGFSGATVLRRALRGMRGVHELRTAMGELYLQAEQYTPSVRMFDAAVRMGADERSSMVARGIAYIRLRRLRQATESLARARELAEEAGGPDSGSVLLRARTAVLEGRIHYFHGHNGPARAAAELALGLDEASTDAHLLLAELALRTGADPVPHLVAAVEGPGSSPTAAGTLARRRGPSAEGCELARHYRRAAPRGEIASQIREFIRDCPR